MAAWNKYVYTVKEGVGQIHERGLLIREGEPFKSDIRMDVLEALVKEGKLILTIDGVVEGAPVVEKEEEDKDEDKTADDLKSEDTPVETETPVDPEAPATTEETPAADIVTNEETPAGEPEATKDETPATDEKADEKAE